MGKYRREYKIWRKYLEISGSQVSTILVNNEHNVINSLGSQGLDSKVTVWQKYDVSKLSLKVT